MKPYALAALLACALSITACGKKDDAPARSTSTQSQQSAEKALTSGDFKPTEKPMAF